MVMKSRKMKKSEQYGKNLLSFHQIHDLGSFDLKSLQAENLSDVVLHSSCSTIILFWEFVIFLQKLLSYIGRNAKYAQINEYLREEYEVAQRFGSFGFQIEILGGMQDSPSCAYSFVKEA